MIACLSAGHGWYGPGKLCVLCDGAVGHGLFEPDVVWDEGENQGMVNRASYHFKGHGHTVRLPRTSRKMLALTKKADIAKRIQIATGSDLFLEFHCNSVKNQSARGFEILVHKDDVRSWQLAREIEIALQKCFGDRIPSRGVKWDSQSQYGSIGVLRELSDEMPAILIECGFLSNPKDAGLLKMTTFRRDFARVVAVSCCSSRVWKVKEIIPGVKK